MITIAAVGDVHLGPDAGGTLRPALDRIRNHADILLLAGDLTQHGTVAEAEVVAAEFRSIGVPVIAVLGNHDYHSDSVEEVTAVLQNARIRVLEGDAVQLVINGHRLGIAGVKGFGGGFAGKCGSAFGEPEMKSFVHHTIDTSERLRTALESLNCDIRIALTHYAPIPHTLRGEPPEIYPFLGAYQLGEAIDATGADLALHGHAHFGREQGVTPGGVRVRNVAQPVIRSAYAAYNLEPAARAETVSAGEVPGRG